MLGRLLERLLGVPTGAGRAGSLQKSMGGAYEIRLMGDPVLRQRATEISDIDGRVVRMVNDMLPAMYEAQGIGLAAPQVGIQRRVFVFDLQEGDGPQTLINPEIVESDGEWTYAEGCLSVPGLTFDIVRPKQVHIVGLDLDGNQVSIEADELLARLFQHELDHLDGTLLVDHLPRAERKAALRDWRNQLNQLQSGSNGAKTDGPIPLVGRRAVSDDD